MTRVGRDLVQFHLRAGHMGETEVPWRMGGKLRETSALCDPRDDLRPHHQRKWPGGVPMRLRQEKWSPFGGEGSSPLQVGLKEPAGDGAIADHTLASILGMFCPNAELTVGEIEITDLGGDQLFTSQSAIVGQQ